MELLSDKRSTLLIGAAGIGIFLLITSSWIFSGPSPADNNTSLFKPIASVEQRAFDIYVTAAAELDARQSVNLSTGLPSNTAKVLYLVPEGTLVEKGDIVARFDPTPFEDKIQQFENDIRDESTNLSQAEAEQKLQESEHEDQSARLKHQIEVAQLKLHSLKNAEHPLRLARSEKELNDTQTAYQRALQVRQTEEELLEQGLTNAKARDEAVDAEQQQRAALDIAKKNLSTLKTIALPGEIRQAELNLRGKENAYAYFQTSQAHKKQKHSAQIERSRNKINVLEQELAKEQLHLERTTLRASVKGIVLYKILTLQREKRKVQVGDTLWNRQSFAVIPDLSHMVARVEVREHELGKLEVGQAVTIQPQAYPELTLTGSVDSVGVLASNDGKQQSDNRFEVRIALDNTDPRLRPGMSARASILTNSFESATLVPVEAVFYENQQAVCFLWRNGDPLRVPVEVGGSDGRQIVVHNGLEPEQEVMLVYPTAFDT